MSEIEESMRGRIENFGRPISRRFNRRDSTEVTDAAENLETAISVAEQDILALAEEEKLEEKGVKESFSPYKEKNFLEYEDWREDMIIFLEAFNYKGKVVEEVLVLFEQMREKVGAEFLRKMARFLRGTAEYKEEIEEFKRSEEKD